MNNLGSTFKSLDQWGEGVGLQIKGEDRYNSFTGAFLALIIIIITLSYAIKQYDTMIKYEATNYMQIVQKNVNEEKEFSFEEMNFDLAFGIFDIRQYPFEVI